MESGKFLAVGVIDDGTQVTATVHALATFINAEPSDHIVVSFTDGEDEHQTVIEKGNVTWLSIERVF